MKFLTHPSRLLPAFLALMLLSVTLSSCVKDDDDFMAYDLTGQWSIASPVQGLIEFYEDGSGHYWFVDDEDVEWEDDFSWWTNNPRLTISSWNNEFFPTGDYNVYFGPAAVTLNPVGGGIPIVLEP